MRGPWIKPGGIIESEVGGKLRLMECSADLGVPFRGGTVFGGAGMLRFVTGWPTPVAFMADDVVDLAVMRAAALPSSTLVAVEWPGD